MQRSCELYASKAKKLQAWKEEKISREEERKTELNKEIHICQLLQSDLIGVPK